MPTSSYPQGFNITSNSPSTGPQPIFESGSNSVTQQKHGSGSGVSDLDVTLTQSPGKLTFDYNITGNLEVSFGNFSNFLMGKGSNATTAHLVVNPTRISNIQSQIQNSLVSKLSSTTGIPSQFFKGHIGTSLPSGSKFQQSIPISLKASANSYIGGGVHEAGHSPVKGSKTITFPTVKLPVPSSVDIEKLIPQNARPKITFTVKPKSVLYSVVRNRAKVTFTLDPGLFIEKIDLGAIPCDQIFKSIGNNISSTESNSKQLRSEIDSYVSQVDNIKNQILSHSTQSRILDVAPSNISGLGSSELSSFKSKINGLSNYKNKLSNIQSSYNNVQNQVSNIKYGRCNSNMKDSLNVIQSDITHIQNKINSVQQDVNHLKDVLSNVSGLSCSNRYGSIQSDINNIKNSLNLSSSGSVPSSIGISTLEKEANNIKNVENKVNNNLNSGSSCYNLFMSQISSLKSSVQSAISNTQGGCGQISKSILNQVASFSAAANQFSSLQIQRRTQNRFSSLINEGQNLINKINNQVSNSNPCKQQKLSQVHNSLSKIKSAGPRSPKSLPCSDQYSSVNKEIQNFQNTVSSLSAPLSPKDLQSITQQARKIRKNIQNTIPAGDPCRHSMVSKMNVLVQHAQNLAPRVRITTGGKSNQSTRQQQILKQLQASLKQLSG